MLKILTIGLMPLLGILNCTQMKEVNHTVESVSKTDIEFKELETTQNKSLYYVVREPSLIDHTTKMLVLLHGVGSNEQSMMEIAEGLPKEYLIVSARGPIKYSNSSFAWYDVDFSAGKPSYKPEQAEKSKITINDFISKIQSKYNITSANTTLLGFSQGGIMAYSLGLLPNTKISKIIVIGGRILREAKEDNLSEPDSFKAMIIHGTNDEILKYDYAIDAIKFMEDKGYDVTHFKHHQGHNVPGNSITAIKGFINQE